MYNGWWNQGNKDKIKRWLDVSRQAKVLGGAYVLLARLIGAHSIRRSIQLCAHFVDDRCGAIMRSDSTRSPVSIVRTT